MPARSEQDLWTPTTENFSSEFPHSLDPEPPVDVPGKLTVNLREADVRATVTSACSRPTHHCASLPSP